MCSFPLQFVSESKSISVVDNILKNKTSSPSCLTDKTQDILECVVQVAASSPGWAMRRRDECLSRLSEEGIIFHVPGVEAGGLICCCAVVLLCCCCCELARPLIVLCSHVRHLTNK